MPKTSKSSPLRYAPYVPLRNIKVNSQLKQEEDEPDDATLREVVTRLGGTMVGLQHDVDHFVAYFDGGSFKMSEACEEFVGRHTNHYDQFIPVSEMFQKLNEMLAKSLPSEDECVHKITYNNTVFPIRALKYTELGVTMDNPYLKTDGVVVSSDAKVDIVALRYKKRRRDVWETELIRYQILSNMDGSVFVVSCMEVGLHDAVHFAHALDEHYVWTRRTFPTLLEAETHLTTEHLEPHKKQPNDFMFVVLFTHASGESSLRMEKIIL